MTERQGLIRKAEKFPGSAQILMESGDQDSAVSRIYYAAFYVAEARAFIEAAKGWLTKEGFLKS